MPSAPIRRLRPWLDAARRRLTNAPFSTTRRLLLGTVALAAGGALWSRTLIAREYTAENVMAALCDRMLPASGAHPGALAAGVDRLVLADIAPLRDGAVLAQLVEDARALDFLELTAAEQDAVLSQVLHESGGEGATAVLRHVLDRAVRHYLASPASWQALGYRKPQPLGYPDFANCGGSGAA